MRCIPCEGTKVSEWPLDQLPGLKYLLDAGTLCKPHQAEAEEKLKGSKTVKPYVLKKEPFVPKKVEVKRDYNEREPGCDDD